MARTIYKQAIERLQTVRDAVRFAASRFAKAELAFGHGNANGWDEAAYLVMHTLGLGMTELEPSLDARLTETEMRAVLEVIRRRCAHVPAAYLTREAWLGPYRFYIDERALIPRSFIAELLLDGLSPWIAEPGSVKRVLDLCTGSGCLAIIAADIFPNAQIDAVDISSEALAVARTNVAQYNLSHRITLFESDLFGAVPDGRYDLILSNPPYVNAASMTHLPKEYRHEPSLALAGGRDGLDVVRRILADAGAHLIRGSRKRGLLIVEIGHERAHLEAAFPVLDCTWLSTSAGDDMVFLIEANQLQTVNKS